MARLGTGHTTLKELLGSKQKDASRFRGGPVLQLYIAGKRWLQGISSKRALVSNTRAHRNLLHNWILLVIESNTWYEMVE